MTADQREVYESELKVLLNELVGNIEEVIAFDHTVRSSLNKGNRNSPAGHVHGDYDQDQGINRQVLILGVAIVNPETSGENVDIAYDAEPVLCPTHGYESTHKTLHYTTECEICWVKRNQRSGWAVVTIT